MAKDNTLWVYAAIGIIGALLMGWISIPDFGGDNEDLSALYPSDLKTSITLNTGDALATTATNANVSYFVFTSDGKYLKEGTTSTGTASFTVPTGADYKLILYDDSSATASLDYLPVVVEFTTNGADPTGRADKTVNVDLFRESNATLSTVRDPVDLDTTVSVGAGQTVNFDVVYSVESSRAVLNGPTFRILVNSTNVESVNMDSLSPATCPDRLSTAANQKDYCFKDDRQIKSSEGTQTVSGNFVMDGTNGVAADNVTVSILDTGIYKESNYKTQGFSAFKYGTENPVDDSNVGSGDSASIGLIMA